MFFVLLLASSSIAYNDSIEEKILDGIGLGGLLPRTTQSFFTELQYNNPESMQSKFTIDNTGRQSGTGNLTISFNNVCGQGLKYKIYVNDTCYKQVPVFEQKTKCEFNKTIEKEQCQDVVYQVENKTENYDCQKEVSEIPIDTKDYTVKITDWNIAKCNDGVGYKIDWIPTLNIGDKQYTQEDWAWLNTSYHSRYKIDCTSIPKGVIIVLNGTKGIKLNATSAQYIWTRCEPDLYLYYNAYNLWTIANDTKVVPFDVELGNRTSNSPHLIYNQYYRSVLHLNNASDSSTVGATLTYSGGTTFTNSQGYLGKGVSLAHDSDYLKMYNPNLFNSRIGIPFTEMCWAKPIENERNDIIGIYNNRVGFSTNEWQWFLRQDASLKFVSFSTYKNVVKALKTSTPSTTLNTWSHVVQTYNGTKFALFVNGTYIGQNASSNNDSHLPDTLFIGGSPVSATYTFNGSIDECIVINQSVNSTDLSYLYNNQKFTLTYGSATQNKVVIINPIITITLPSNGTVYLKQGIPLNVSADMIISKWIYQLNGGINTTFTPNTTILGSSGVNTLIVWANSTSNRIGRRTATFTLHSTPNTTTLLVPSPNAFDAVDLDARVRCLGNFTGETLKAYIQFYEAEPSIVKGVFTNSIVTNNTFTSIYNLSNTLTTIGKKYYFEAWCGNTLANSTHIFSSNTTIVTNYTAKVLNNTLTPKQAYLGQNLVGKIKCYTNESEVIYGYCQYYNASVNSVAYGTKYRVVIANNTLTYVCNLSGIVTSIGNKWFARTWCGDGTSNSTILDSTNTSIVSGYVNGTIFHPTKTKVYYVVGNDNLTGATSTIVNESCLIVIGGSYAGTYCFNSSSNTYFDIMEYQNIIPSVYGGEQTVLTLYMNKTSNVSEINAEMVWNKTKKLVVRTDYGYYYKFTSTFYTNPVALDIRLNTTWKVNESLVNGSKVRFNITKTQNNLAFGFDNCTTGTKTLTIKVYNEELPSTLLNASVDVNAQVWVTNYASYFNFSKSLRGNHTYSFCITPSNATLHTNIYIYYNSTYGFTHKYIAYNLTLSNVTQTINMFNFNLQKSNLTTYTTLPTTTSSSNSSYIPSTNHTNTTTTSGGYTYITTTPVSTDTIILTLRVTARNENNFALYPKIVMELQRWYPADNVWRTVQMDESGDFGLGVFNVKEKSTDYRLRFRDINNHVLKVTDKLRFSCTNYLCDVSTSLSPWKFTHFTTNVTVNSTYNPKTGIINVVWDDPQLLITGAYITVSQEKPSNSVVICNYSQTVAPQSGSYNCNVSNYLGTINVAFRATSSQMSLIQTFVYIKTMSEELMKYVGEKETYFYSFLIFLLFATMGLVSPAVAVISVVPGVIILMYLGLANWITYSSIVVACIIGFLIAYKVKQ